MPDDNLLGSLEFPPLPESVVPVDGILLVKAIDEEGVPSWYTLMTASLMDIEACGILDVAHETMRQGAVAMGIPFDEEYEGED